MSTFYIVGGKPSSCNVFDTEQVAIEKAKRSVSGGDLPFYVYKAVQKVQAPVPEAIVTAIN